MSGAKRSALMVAAGTLAILAACGESPTSPPNAAVRFAGQQAGVVPVSLVSVTPPTATIAAGATQQYTAINSLGAAMVAGAVTWSVNAGGAINANGLFTAGAAAGTFTITATDAFNGVSATALVTITVASGGGSGGTGSGDTCKANDDKKKCEKERADKGNDDEHDDKGDKGGKDKNGKDKDGKSKGDGRKNN